MDGESFPLSEMKVGVNYPPIHPWCRCTTKPDDEDMRELEKDSERWTRDPETGEFMTVRGDMTYKEWQAEQAKLHGADALPIAQKKIYNRSADIKQLAAYQERLGVENFPKTLAAFQEIKYNNDSAYTVLKGDYRYRGMLDERTVFQFSDLPNGLQFSAKPYSIADKTDDSGNVLQRRIYGRSGKALADIDTTDHGRRDLHPTGAHKHIFTSKKNPHGAPIGFRDLDLKRNADIIKKGVNYFDGE
ncbi:MAG: hypothetical protein PHX51_08095 [Clostridia bacterium]|nr:hypothetical protein [Clostridia bacterium]